MQRLERGQAGYDAWTRRTDTPLLGLAVAFVVVLALPYSVDLSHDGHIALDVANVAIWAAFAVDYAGRLYLAEHRGTFVRHHVPDLVVVLVPFLRPLRTLRLLRLGGLLGVLYRRSASFHARVTTAVAASVAVSLVLASLAMYDAEKDAPNGNIHTFADALWWAGTTVTTVGYGDRYPTTTYGRAIAGALMLVGIALLGVVTAAVAAWFVDRLRPVEEAEREQAATLDEVLAELRRLHHRLDRIEGRDRLHADDDLGQDV